MTKSRILIAHSGDRVHIKVEGKGTFENAGAFKLAYQQFLAKGIKKFVIDLSACENLDSTFLGILLSLALRAKEVSGRAGISKANPEVMKLFRNLGLDRLFEFDKAKPSD